jgi:PAS domain S-box-containing protein
VSISGPFDGDQATRACNWLGALLAIAIVSCWTGKARAEPTQSRVLILSGFNYTFPAATQVINGIEKRLNASGPQKFVIDAEFLDLVRVSDPDHETRTATFVKEKYAGKRPDVVIAVGSTVLQFIRKYPDVLSPDIPLVFAGISPETYSSPQPPANTTGVFYKLSLGPTLELAERLQPRAQKLFVIAGAFIGEDSRWQQAARQTIEQHRRKYETTYLFGLTLDTLTSEVSRIPRDAIVIFLSFFVDGTGKVFIPRNVVREVARLSPAPVYAPYDSYIGSGVVGGFVETFESHGAAAAHLVSEIVGGADPAALPPRTNPEQGIRVDARAMERWGLKRSDLPPDSTVLFSEPTLWEQHRYLISAVVLVLALQSAIVAALLFQRRRRRQAETSLKESEDRMTFTAAAVNVGLWQFDRTTDELWATEHCRAMFGLAKDTAITRETFLAAVHPEDRPVAVGTLRGALRGGAAVTDVRVVRPDGEVRWIRLRARSHLDERGAPDQLSGIFIDITDHKAAESEAELQRQEVAHLMRVSVLGELSGAIAHEVNQPLTAILSNAQAALYLLGRDSPNLDEVREALQDIVQEDNRAGEVIQRLRGLLKKGESSAEPVDLNELVMSTTKLLRNELIERRITLETNLAIGRPSTFGDPVQLQQVLLNLTVNAMDAMAATPAEQRRIHVSTRETPAGTIEFFVRDHGPGIKPAGGKQVFEPFYTTKDHGLGLGLTICSTIIRKHGGTIDLRNDETGGAVAKVSLPARVMLMAAQ